MRESEIERELRERVQALGGMCIKVEAIGFRGFFDRLVVLPGGWIRFVELKRPKGGRLSVHQKYLIERFTELGAGATTAVIRNSKDIDRLLSC